MSHLNSRNDLFSIEFPKVFIPKDIKAKWKPYLFKLPTMINSVSDVINYSIQSITIPSLNYDPVDQWGAGYDVSKKGKNTRWRSAMDQDETYDKQFTVSFKSMDGHANYWILLQSYLYYYNHSTKAPFTFNLPVRYLDSEGNVLYTLEFQRVLFTGMSELSLNYSENTNDASFFECTFSFNEMELKFETD